MINFLKKNIYHLVFFILIIFFTIFYFSNFSYGALGNDSPGYIFTASKYYHNESPTYRDELVSDLLLKYNKDEIGFALPHFNYKLISEDGKITPKNSTGGPYLMALMAKLFGEEGFYYLNPLCGIIILISLYLLIIDLFKKFKYKYILGLSSVFILGIMPHFWSYIMCEPLREISSLAFILLSFWLFSLAIKKPNYILISLSAFIFGWSINIRENAILFIICFPILYFIYKKKFNLKIIIAISIIFFIFTSLAYSFTLRNNYKAQNEIESTTGESLTANADHIKNIKIKNWWDNQGKFRTGQGGLSIYYNHIKEIFFLPFVIFFIILGLIINLFQNWKLGILFLSATVPTYLLFSAWINPYTRYIYAVIPLLTCLLVYGLIFIIENINQLLKPKMQIFYKSLIIIILTIFLLPQITSAFSIFSGEKMPSTRSISKNDFNTINNLSISDDKTVLICLGNSIYMSAFIEAHTRIRTIKAPPNEKINEIINYLIDKNYSVYIWDDGTNIEQKDILKTYFSHSLYVSLIFDFIDNYISNLKIPGNKVNVYKIINN